MFCSILLVNRGKEQGQGQEPGPRAWAMGQGQGPRAGAKGLGRSFFISSEDYKQGHTTQYIQGLKQLLEVTKGDLKSVALKLPFAYGKRCWPRNCSAKVLDVGGQVHDDERTIDVHMSQSGFD